MSEQAWAAERKQGEVARAVCEQGSSRQEEANEAAGSGKMANRAINNGRPWHSKEILKRSWAFEEQEQAVSEVTKKDIVGREQPQLLGEKEGEAGSKCGWPKQAVNKSSKAHTWHKREQLRKGESEAGREVLRVGDKEDKAVGQQGKMTMGQEYSK